MFCFSPFIRFLHIRKLDAFICLRINAITSVPLFQTGTRWLQRSSVFPGHFYDSVCLLNRKLFCHNEVKSVSIKTKSVWFCFDSMGKTMEAYQPLNAITFRTAALDILKATGEPMHYTEIARGGDQNGLLAATG